MSIVRPVPYNIQSGQNIDAGAITRDLIQIVEDINANAATAAGNPAQAFAVASASSSSQAVNLGQLQNASVNANLSGLTVTQNITSLPANYGSNQIQLLRATTPTAGVTWTSTDPRILSAGLGTNGPFIQTATLPLDLTNSAGVLVPNATASNQAVNLGQVATPSNGGYTNVTTSRAIGTTYTNSTGRPLLVQVEVQTAATAGAGTRLLVNGGEVSCFYTTAASAAYGIMIAIVPPGQTYQVANAVGSNSISIWQEY